MKSEYAEDTNVRGSTLFLALNLLIMSCPSSHRAIIVIQRHVAYFDPAMQNTHRK